MAAAFESVSAGSNSGASNIGTVTCTMSASAVAGSFALFVFCNSTPNTITTTNLVSSGSGHNWVYLGFAQQAAALGLYVWGKTVEAGDINATVSYVQGVSNHWDAACITYSGVDGWDLTFSNLNSNVADTNMPFNPMTPRFDNEMLVAIAATGQSVGTCTIATPSTGFTARYDDSSTVAGFRELYIQDSLLGSATQGVSQTPSTVTTSQTLGQKASLVLALRPTGQSISIVLPQPGGEQTRQRRPQQIWPYAPAPAPVILSVPVDNVRPDRRLVPRAKHRSGQVPPSQVVPPATTGDSSHGQRPRPVLLRKHHGAEVVPPQFNPPIQPTVLRERRRVNTLARRGKVVQPVQQQQNPPIQPTVLREGRRLVTFLAKHRTPVPPPEQDDASLATNVRRRRFFQWPTRAAGAPEVVPTAAAPVAPNWVPDRWRRRFVNAVRPRRNDRIETLGIPLATDDMSSFEGGLGTWVSLGGTLSQSSTQAYMGTSSAKTVITSGGTVSVYRSHNTGVSAGFGPIYPGDVLRFVCRIYAETNTRNIQPSFNWRRADNFNAAGPQVVLGSTSCTVGQWTTLQGTVTVPSSPGIAGVALDFTGTGTAANDVFYLDDVQVYRVSFTPPQFPPVQVLRSSNRQRGRQFRRLRGAEVVPPQFNPPIQPAVLRGTRRRAMLARRGRSAEAPVTQAVTPPPAFVSVSLVHRARVWVARRGKIVTPVRPQENPPQAPAPVSRRTRPGATRRGTRRASWPVPGTEYPPAVLGRRRPAPGRPRGTRGQARPVAQPLAPVLVHLWRRRRPVAAQMRRRTIGFFEAIARITSSAGTMGSGNATGSRMDPGSSTGAAMQSSSTTGAKMDTGTATGSRMDPGSKTGPTMGA